MDGRMVNGLFWGHKTCGNPHSHSSIIVVIDVLIADGRTPPWIALHTRFVWRYIENRVPHEISWLIIDFLIWTDHVIYAFNPVGKKYTVVNWDHQPISMLVPKHCVKPPPCHCQHQTRWHVLAGAAPGRGWSPKGWWTWTSLVSGAWFFFAKLAYKKLDQEFMVDRLTEVNGRYDYRHTIV